VCVDTEFPPVDVPPGMRNEGDPQTPAAQAATTTAAVREVQDIVPARAPLQGQILQPRMLDRDEGSAAQGADHGAAAGPGGLGGFGGTTPMIPMMVPIRSAVLSTKFGGSCRGILAQAGTARRKVSQPAWHAIPAACSWSSKCACESSRRTGSCNVRTLGT
jgi:hypothetical protein